MKRAFILFAIPILCFSALGQDNASTMPLPPASPSPQSTAAAIAAKDDAQERYERLEADLQAVQADNEDLHTKITAMEQEIDTLRQAQARAADNSGVQDELKRLADAIQEVDKKRMEDKDAIAEEIRKSIGGLEQSLGNSAAPVHASRTKPVASEESPAAANGFVYTVHPGDRLDLIVSAYNADFKSKGLKTITRKQTREANPNVDWSRLRVGQKIIIPRPDAE
jgi:TolA-binding protein